MSISLKPSNKRIFFLLRWALFPFILTTGACASKSTITLFQNKPATTGRPAPVPEDKVGIYRATHPFTPFTEMGIISYHANSFKLQSFYAHLRHDAALQGADAIVDVKMDSKEHSETRIVQVCTPETRVNTDGTITTEQNCHPEAQSDEVMTYNMVGSLIRKNP